MNKNRIISTILLVVVLIIPIFLNISDNYFNGDEIVSFSMANNENGGFIFSEGRVASYLKNKIFSSKISDTINNLFDTAKDILTNKSNSDFFQYQVNEIKLYSQEEINDIMSKTHSSELFNIGKTWLHSQSDESNSYLYYSVLNIVSSVFPSASNTKWPGFIINYLSYIAIIILLYKLLKKMNVGNFYATEMIFATCLSISILGMVTYIRAYMMAMVFSLGLVDIHMDIYDQIYKNNLINKKTLFKLSIIYIFGFICHYTIGIVLVSLGIATLIVLIKTKIEFKEILHYVITCAISVIIGIIIDPKCVIGLVKKFLGNQGRSSSLFERFNIIFRYFTTTLFSNVFLCITAMVLICFCIFLIFRNNKKEMSINNRWVYLSFFSLIYMITITISTNSTNYCVIMYPCLSIIIIKLLLIGFDKKRWIVTMFIIINVLFSIGSTYYSLNESNLISKNKEIILKEYSGYDCIYFRNHGNGYADFVHLNKFSKIIVISINSPNWKEQANQYIKGGSFVIYFPDNTYNKELESWLLTNNIELKDKIYLDYNTTVFIN